MKKFWKRTEGFTLVELVVVIAILGILAGVGTVGYSGYVKKANMAADQQLLANLNTAFSVACIENGVDSRDLTDAFIDLDSDGTVDVASLRVVHSRLSENDCDTAFVKYFEGGQFKVIRRLVYTNGIFVDPENAGTNGMKSIDLPNGAKLYVTNEQFEALNNSTYKKDIAGLMTQVDGIAALVEQLLAGNGVNTNAQALLAQFMGNTDHLVSMIKALGGDVNAEDLTMEYVNVMMGLVNDQVKAGLAKELGIDVDEVTQEMLDDANNSDIVDSLTAAATTEVQKNMLVMGIAQNAVGQGTAGIMEIINSDTPKDDLINAIKDPSNTNGMGSAALVYGIFTAYAKSDEATTGAQDAIVSTDPTAVFDILEDEDELKSFRDYVSGEQGKKDLDACIAAMGVVGNNATEKDTVTGILTNGVADADFIAAFENLFK